MSKNLLIFHSNVDGYECHSDGLREILSNSSINFGVVCLSVTSQQSDYAFPKNGTLITLPLRTPPPPPPPPTRLVCFMQLLGDISLSSSD